MMQMQSAGVSNPVLPAAATKSSILKPTVINEEKSTGTWSLYLLEFFFFLFAFLLTFFLFQYLHCRSRIDSCWADVQAARAKNTGIWGPYTQPTYHDDIIPEDCEGVTYPNNWYAAPSAASNCFFVPTIPVLLCLCFLFPFRLYEACKCDTLLYLRSLAGQTSEFMVDPMNEGAIRQQKIYADSLFLSPVAIKFYVRCFHIETRRTKNGTQEYEKTTFSHTYDFSPMMHAINTTAWSSEDLQKELRRVRDSAADGTPIYVELDSKEDIVWDPCLGEYLGNMESYLRGANGYRDRHTQVTKTIKLVKNTEPKQLVALGSGGFWFMTTWAFWVYWFLFLTICYRRAFERLTKICYLKYSHNVVCVDPTFRVPMAGGESASNGLMPMFDLIPAASATSRPMTTAVESARNVELQQQIKALESQLASNV
jgi:hypothetical protein